MKHFCHNFYLFVSRKTDLHDIYIMQPSFTTNEKLKILATQGRPNSNYPTEFSNMPILEKFMGKIDKV